MLDGVQASALIAPQPDALPNAIRPGINYLRSVALDVPLLIGIVLGAVLWAWLIWDVRDQLRHSAEQRGLGLSASAADSIRHIIDPLDAAIDGAIRTSSMPGFWNLPHEVQQAALFGAVAEFKPLSQMIVLDSGGRLKATSSDMQASPSDFSDRDYFVNHRNDPDPTLLLSQTRSSRIRGKPLVILSKRINDQRGNFAGVVVGGLAMSAFDDVLRQMHVGQDDLAAIMFTDGSIVSHIPQDMGAGTLEFGHLQTHLEQADGGSFTDVSPLDARSRLVTYQKVDGLPLVVVYGQATHTVFAEWARLVLYSVSLLAALKAIKIVLIFMLRRERLTRLKAEQQVRISAATLTTVNQDLEDRIAAEIQSRHDTLQQSAKNQRLEALGQLAGGIAHDVNNVLQTISGACSLLENRAGSNPEVKRLTAIALSAADRGNAVTRRLLVFARKAVIKPDNFDIVSTLTDLREILNHTLCDNARVELQIAGAQMWVRADRMQLETVLINLSTNARDAMPNGGVITISAQVQAVDRADAESHSIAPGPYVRVDVADTGMGMDATVLARASEPFFTTKGLGKGTGLGLSMAKGFAEQSGGKFAISSQLGIGTTVSLWFPAVQDLPSLETPLNAPSPAQPVRRDSFKRSWILVVDDNAAARELIAEGLRDTGLQVSQASSGLEALALIKNGAEIDLLLTDLSMPGMDGIQLIRASRGHKPNLPAIILTGNVGAVAGLEIEEAVGGRCLVLQKPIDLREMPAYIDVALSSGSLTSAMVLLGLGRVLLAT